MNGDILRTSKDVKDRRVATSAEARDALMQMMETVYRIFEMSMKEPVGKDKQREIYRLLIALDEYLELVKRYYMSVLFDQTESVF